MGGSQGVKVEKVQTSVVYTSDKSRSYFIVGCCIDDYRSLIYTICGIWTVFAGWDLFDLALKTYMGRRHTLYRCTVKSSREDLYEPWLFH